MSPTTPNQACKIRTLTLHQNGQTVTFYIKHSLLLHASWMKTIQLDQTWLVPHHCSWTPWAKSSWKSISAQLLLPSPSPSLPSYPCFLLASSRFSPFYSVSHETRKLGKPLLPAVQLSMRAQLLKQTIPEKHTLTSLTHNVERDSLYDQWSFQQNINKSVLIIEPCVGTQIMATWASRLSS